MWIQCPCQSRLGVQDDVHHSKKPANSQQVTRKMSYIKTPKWISTAKFYRKTRINLTEMKKVVKDRSVKEKNSRTKCFMYSSGPSSSLAENIFKGRTLSSKEVDEICKTYLIFVTKHCLIRNNKLHYPGPANFGTNWQQDAMGHIASLSEVRFNHFSLIFVNNFFWCF